MHHSPDYLLSLPNDSAIDLKHIQQIPAPRLLDFLHIFQLVSGELSSPSDFYSLLSFFEQIAVDGYSYGLRATSSSDILKREFLHVLSRHGLVVESSQTGSSDVQAILSPKGRAFFRDIYRVLKFSWVSRYAAHEGTFKIPTFSADQRSYDPSSLEADVTFADYLISLIYPGNPDRRDPMADFVDDRTRAYVYVLFQHVDAGGETGGEKLDN